MRKFVIDCDTGTNDAIAVCAAFGCEEIEVIGITSVNGNVAGEYAAKNNLDLVEYLGRTIPVCRGASIPLYSGYVNKSDLTHGKTGLDSVVLPAAKKRKFDSRIASRFLYETAVECGGELELLVTGPMTNIALAVIQYEAFAPLIRHLYFMGGAVWGGNVSTSAEFNIWADPEAAHVVLNSGIPLTMVGLDVTLQAIMEREDVVRLRQSGGSACGFAADLLDFMFTRHEAYGGKDVIMHDAVALAAAVYPECLGFERYYIDAETTGTYTRGHTFADLRNRTGKPSNVRTAMQIDVPAFRNWLVSRIICCDDRRPE
ncbi:MAG: nucleoside hydrolase [Solobacterium sp.]|nr:nucleoside hydrolase [Solobacterium sp.]